MMRTEEIKKKIDSFPRWHYQFDLRGQRTPVGGDRLVNRHEQRKQHFFDPLVQLFGGSLKGKRVLDLASNAGFWSLCAVHAGCDYVLGVEGRKMHVDQSNFVFEAEDIEEQRYDFLLGDIFETDLRQFEPFDIVLCLGLMYHISKPVELMEKISAVNTDVLVIDSTLSKAPGSLLELGWESPEPNRYLNALDRGLVMKPTKGAICDLVEEFGYSVSVLEPDFRDEAGAPRWRGALDYRDGARRAFLCAKATDLSTLSVRTEPIGRSHVRARRSGGAGDRQAKQQQLLVQRAREAEQLLRRTEAALSTTLGSRRWAVVNALAAAWGVVLRRARPRSGDRLRALQVELHAFLQESERASAGARRRGASGIGR